MLLSLHIENIAVIKELDIDFSNGFNVLTGETGAGKSIIIDSINLIMGARADKDIIRSGEAKAVVSAVFVQNDARVAELLDAYGRHCDSDEVMIYKELCTDGKTLTKINGRAASVSALREIAKYLVTIHGQHDNQSLLKSESHLLYLDAFAGLENLKNQYEQAYGQYVSLKGQLAKSKWTNRKNSEKLTLLQYQINDIRRSKAQRGRRGGADKDKEKNKRS